MSPRSRGVCTVWSYLCYSHTSPNSFGEKSVISMESSNKCESCTATSHQASSRVNHLLLLMWVTYIYITRSKVQHHACSPHPVYKTFAPDAQALSCYLPHTHPATHHHNQFTLRNPTTHWFLLQSELFLEWTCYTLAFSMFRSHEYLSSFSYFAV